MKEHYMYNVCYYGALSTMKWSMNNCVCVCTRWYIGDTHEIGFGVQYLWCNLMICGFVCVCMYANTSIDSR